MAPDAHRFFADVEVQEAADLALAVGLGALLLQAPDAQHVGEERNAHAPDSSVEVSPSGKPSSRALSSRRMILPLRVCGSALANSISFGATAAPRRFLAWPRI